MDNNNTLGQQAYTSYGEYVGWKNYQGNPMPTWENLTDAIRGAWEAAASRITDQVLIELGKHQWHSHFDERQQKQIAFARIYAQDFHHGADGHNNMLIIAKLADLLDGKA